LTRPLEEDEHTSTICVRGVVLLIESVGFDPYPANSRICFASFPGNDPQRRCLAPLPSCPKQWCRPPEPHQERQAIAMDRNIGGKTVRVRVRDRVRDWSSCTHVHRRPVIRWISSGEKYVVGDQHREEERRLDLRPRRRLADNSQRSKKAQPGQRSLDT